ncbi:hypothetical protein FRC09_015472 [Ceratobasidium sp. 395]|nr:hypothetical protein FRC09_015472 [Ceratobasidium sp. 395]
MAGTHANPMSRTGMLIFRPGTAMNNHGAGGFDANARGGMQQRIQLPQTPKIGMGMSMSMNGMNFPNLPNTGMNMNVIGADGGVGMGAGNGMSVNMNVGMGMNANNMGMGANRMVNMGANGMATMGMNGMGANSVNPALGMNAGLGGVNPGLGGVNPGLGNVNPGLGGVPPSLGGVNPALGVNPTMARGNPALAGVNPALATGMNPAMSGAMNPALSGSFPPPKLSRCIASSAGPLPSSLTKASGSVALSLPSGINPQTALVAVLPLLKDEADVTHGGALPEVTEDEMRETKKPGARARANLSGNASKPSSARESERPQVNDILINGRDSLSPSLPPGPSPLPFIIDPGSPDSTIGPDSPKPQSTPLPPPPPELPASTRIVEQPLSPPSPINPNGNTPTMATRPLLTASYSSDRVTGQTTEVPLPQWMQDCLTATQLRDPNDRVGVILKPRPQNTEEPAMPKLRLKCLDCPRQAYQPSEVVPQLGMQPSQSFLYPTSTYPIQIPSTARQGYFQTPPTVTMRALHSPAITPATSTMVTPASATTISPVSPIRTRFRFPMTQPPTSVVLREGPQFARAPEAGVEDVVDDNTDIRTEKGSLEMDSEAPEDELCLPPIRTLPPIQTYGMGPDAMSRLPSRHAARCVAEEPAFPAMFCCMALLA